MSREIDADIRGAGQLWVRRGVKGNGANSIRRTETVIYRFNREGQCIGISGVVVGGVLVASAAFIVRVKNRVWKIGRNKKIMGDPF